MADLPIRSFRSPLRVSQMYVHLYTRLLNEFSVDFFFFLVNDESIFRLLRRVNDSRFLEFFKFGNKRFSFWPRELSFDC